MQNLNPPYGLKFGMNKFEIKEILDNKTTANFYDSGSNDEIQEYWWFELASRKINRGYFYFIDKKLCKILFQFDTDLPILKFIQFYNDIKLEINNKYYKSDNDYINYTPPAYENDDFEETYEYNIRKGLIEYASYWNFKSDSNYDDYIILKISQKVEIEVVYQHGDLYREYVESKKQEW